VYRKAKIGERQQTMKNNFWKVRLTDAELALRKRVSQILGKSESQIDRELWEREAARIENDRQRAS